MKASGEKNLNDDMKDTGRDCISFLDQKKAIDPVFMDLRRVNSYLEFFLIVTGNSQTHCRALARDLIKFMHEKGIKEHGNCDLDSEWIIIDFGSVIAHIFTEEMRLYYQLEKLWGDAEKISLN